jgi:hypothetical protein
MVNGDVLGSVRSFYSDRPSPGIGRCIDVRSADRARDAVWTVSLKPAPSRPQNVMPDGTPM